MVTAFIPARGGSKSIPLKNIKFFCGKPLIYWNLLALQKSKVFDRIVVATDSNEIEAVVSSFKFRDVSIYRRSSRNATDTASSESVILEYIHESSISDSEIFVFSQATSPLTRSEDFISALDLFHRNNYDSLLTGVRIKRFFWSESGQAINYKINDRPRRQDFQGWLMENGAFYISKVAAIKATGCRLSGMIGVYEMPGYSAVEIDEEDDWLIAESLMRKHVIPTLDINKKSIKLFLSDVDGTLTDAGMYYDQQGNELKKFNTHDGKGFELLKNAGIKTGFITSETTKIVERRAKKLQIDYLIQGVTASGKIQAALNLCSKEGIDLEEVAYIGDDINCKDLLMHAGMSACPANAVDSIKKIKEGMIVLEKRGGDGAVREFIEIILKNN